MTGNGARKILCVCLAGLIWCLAGCSALRKPNAYPDSNSDLLHGYAEKMDFSALLAKESEVESVGTRSSVLFKNGDRRQMYVFSLPVREERNGLYAVCDTGLYPAGENRFSAENGAYRLTLEESAVYLYAGSDELHLSVDGMRLGASGGYTGETGALSVTPSYSGYVLHYTLEKPAGSMSMTFSGKRYQLQEDPAGYVLFSEEGVNRFIVSQIMAVDRENRVFTEQHFKARRASETYVLTGELPDEAAYPLRVSIGVDVVCDNMFYDASAYEAAPNRNAIFQPVSVFDTLEKKAKRIHLSEMQYPFLCTEAVRAFGQRVSESVCAALRGGRGCGDLFCAEGLVQLDAQLEYPSAPQRQARRIHRAGCGMVYN